MKDKDIISKGPKRRDEACYQVLHDIVIPAGTILRQQSGKSGEFSCPAEYGIFVLEQSAGEARPDIFKKVIA